MTEYGGKGCRCWAPEDDGGNWRPNAACVHHGLLSGYTERRDTGAYVVVSKPAQDLSTPPDGPECPPGVHSMFDFCPGGCLEPEPDADAEGQAARNEARLLPRGAQREAPSMEQATEALKALRNHLTAADGGTEDDWWERHAEGADTGPADCQWGEKWRCRRHCPDGDAVAVADADIGPVTRHEGVDAMLEYLDGCCGNCQYCRTTTEKRDPCNSANRRGRRSLADLFRGLKRYLT